MKAIMVMFDTLNRRFLSPYGCDWVHTPNFQRLAEKTVIFDTSFVGSMPCMPARRELHTGRLNFLHRAWGPLEPFDDSMPEILRNNGVSSHLISDHYHYWEDGGATYHQRYSTWECVRGQEGDKWVSDLHKPSIPNPNSDGPNAYRKQDWINRQYMQEEERQPQPQTFAKGLQFLDTNHDLDNWFLHLETFDPHEPYFSADKYKELYDHDFSKINADWPTYKPVDEDPGFVEHIRHTSAALHTMCDAYLGKVLDLMDKYDLWKDTMLIVNTDHGFLLGEHDWWAKCAMPFYNEIAHTPLFIWDPRCKKANERRKSLVQTIDLAPTILEFFGIDRPADMMGMPLNETIDTDKRIREAVLYGIHGGHVNVTDGRYVYMRGPAKNENKPLFNYTHMPTHMTCRFAVEEMRTMQWHEPFSFTKKCPVMKIAGGEGRNTHDFSTKLFDNENDYEQAKPLNDEKLEKRMIGLLVGEMKKNDAPAEQYERLGLQEYA